MFSSPSNGMDSIPSRMNGTESPSTPSFLFGNKRRSVAPNGPSFNNSFAPSGPSTDIFATPAPTAIPAHLRPSETAVSSPKSVHWSPSLERHSERSITSHTGSKLSSLTGAGTNAPPLCSLRDDIEPVKKISRRATIVCQFPPKRTERAAEKLNVTEVNKENENTWVTVFGFSQAQFQAVLKLLSKHGEVVSHQRPNQGNFIHMRYSCVEHARQALCRSGSFLDSSTIIGVVPCTDKEVINGTSTSVVSHTASNLNSSRLDDSIAERSMTIPPINETAYENANSSFANTSYVNGNTSLDSSRFSTRGAAGMRSMRAERPISSLATEPKQNGIFNKLWNTIGL